MLKVRKTINNTNNLHAKQDMRFLRGKDMSFFCFCKIIHKSFYAIFSSLTIFSNNSLRYNKKQRIMLNTLAQSVSLVLSRMHKRLTLILSWSVTPAQWDR